MKRSQIHPNTMIRTKTWINGPMGWIDCICCEKLQRYFVARTFALIAPVHPDLLRVSCYYEIVPNATKHYATHQNMSLGFNGVDRMRSLRKITTWLRGTNFCINCTSSPHFALNLRNILNAPKHYETDQNLNLGSNGMDWVRFLRKNYNVTFWHELLH